MIVDYDANDNVIEIDILRLSERVVQNMLKKVEFEAAGKPFVVR